MNAINFERCLSSMRLLPGHRQQEVLAVVAGLIKHDAAIFTWPELVRFAEREEISVMELAGAIEHCWLCGWCGYDPQSGMVGGGAMEAFRTEGQEQDELIEGRLAR